MSVNVVVVMPEKKASSDDFDFDGYDESRVLSSKFIKMYENFPELWNSKDPSDTSSAKKTVAIDKLLVVYSKIKPGASREDVKRKICKLHSQYKEETKKLLSSLRQAATNNNEIYKPSWKFHALSFLKKTAYTVDLIGQKEPIVVNATTSPPQSPIIDSILEQSQISAINESWTEQSLIDLTYESSSTSFQFNESTESLTEQSLIDLTDESSPAQSRINVFTESLPPAQRPSEVIAQSSLTQPEIGIIHESSTAQSPIKKIDESMPGQSRIDIIDESPPAQSPMEEIVESSQPQSLYIALPSPSQSAIEPIAESSQQHSVLCTSTTNMETPIKRPRVAQPKAKLSERFMTENPFSAKRRNKQTPGEHFVLSRLWANKLRRLEPYQKLLAEKAANDILFKAQLGKLK